jgi:predicted secreted acid phosphatase
MNFLLIIILLIILLIILTILKEKFNNYSYSEYSEDSEELMVRKNKDAYQTAYELGINYLNIMNERDYYNLKHPAVMFDIDDTLIEFSGKPIKPIIKLLNKCISEGLLVIIITARSSIFYNETVHELVNNKIRWSYLFMRNANDSINTFKSIIKKKLAENENINIIMSVGDNVIDIDGDYSGYWIKLPNHNDSNLYHLNSEGKPELINF